MPNDLTADDLDRALASIEIPPCPSILLEVLAEARKDEPDLRALARTIGADVGMAALAIKLANSPLFRVGNPATNIAQALTRLGTRNVVCIVTAVALRATLTGLPPDLIEPFWNRVSTVALGAGLVARRQHGVSSDTAYLYGLFHDAAIPALMRRFPEYAKVTAEAARRRRPIVELEAELLRCTHPIVGALLVRNWGLPTVLAQAVRFHHEADVYALPEGILDPEAIGLIAVVHVAEHLACEVLQEADLEVGPLFVRALAYLGLDSNDLEDYVEDLRAARDAAAR